VPVWDQLEDHVTAGGNAELSLFLAPSAEYLDVDYDIDTNEFKEDWADQGMWACGIRP
jgi:hypothetical protein